MLVTSGYNRGIGMMTSQKLNFESEINTEVGLVISLILLRSQLGLYNVFTMVSAFSSVENQLKSSSSYQVSILEKS